MAGTSYFNTVQLIKDGSQTGDDKASGSLTSSFVEYSFGGSSDLWSLSLSPSDINSSDFGVAIGFYGSGFSTENYTTSDLEATNFSFSIPSEATINGIEVFVEAKEDDAEASDGLPPLPGTTSAFIDYVKIKVYYTDDSGTNMQINISDSWKEIDAMKINISDSWKDVAAAKINIGDSWKDIF